MMMMMMILTHGPTDSTVHSYLRAWHGMAALSYVIECVNHSQSVCETRHCLSVCLPARLQSVSQ